MPYIYRFFDHETKTTDLILFQSELSNLKKLHNADSVKIVKLSSDIKKQNEEISKLKKDVALYQKREKHLKTYPSVYNDVMKIK